MLDKRAKGRPVAAAVYFACYSGYHNMQTAQLTVKTLNSPVKPTSKLIFSIFGFIYSDPLIDLHSLRGQFVGLFVDKHDPMEKPFLPLLLSHFAAHRMLCSPFIHCWLYEKLHEYEWFHRFRLISKRM